MHLTVYQRSYPVRGAPVAVSLVPYPTHQRHTFTAGGKVYEAEYRELRLIVPDDAKFDAVSNLLCWVGDKGPVKATAKEVFDLAEAAMSGFRMAD